MPCIPKASATLALIVFLFRGAPVFCQETPQAAPGDRIRVTAPDCQLRKQTGILMSVENGVLAARVDEEEIHCPVEAVEGLEVSSGQRHWYHGSFAGLFTGALGGGIALAALFHCTPDAEDCPSTGWRFSFGAVFGGLSGLIVGTLVGVARGAEGWQKVPVPLAQPSVSVSSRGSFGIRFRVPIRR